MKIKDLLCLFWFGEVVFLGYLINCESNGGFGWSVYICRNMFFKRCIDFES